MTDEQLLIPLGQASRKLSMSGKTLRKHIDANLIRTVKIGPRSYIPRAEMDRLTGVSRPAVEVEELSSKPAKENHAGPQSGVEKLPNGKIYSTLSAKERLDAILGDSADFLVGLDELAEDANCGNPLAVAAKKALDTLTAMPFKWIGPGTPVSAERQKAIEAHHATWQAWRESWRNRYPGSPQLSCS